MVAVAEEAACGRGLQDDHLGKNPCQTCSPPPQAATFAQPALAVHPKKAHHTGAPPTAAHALELARRVARRVAKARQPQGAHVRIVQARQRRRHLAVHAGALRGGQAGQVGVQENVALQAAGGGCAWRT